MATSWPITTGVCSSASVASRMRACRRRSTTLKRRTGRSAVGVPLGGGRWPHLDMAMADLGGRGWLVHPRALNGYDPTDAAWRSLFAGRPIIEVEADEGDRLACNVVMAGDVVIGPSIGPVTRSRIEALGFDYEAVDVGELTKAGGGVHCLTLELPTAMVRAGEQRAAFAVA